MTDEATTGTQPRLLVEGHPTDEELAALAAVVLRTPPEAPQRQTRHGRRPRAWEPVRQGEES